MLTGAGVLVALAADEVNVSQPSDVLTARAAAAGAFDSLFLGSAWPR